MSIEMSKEKLIEELEKKYWWRFSGSHYKSIIEKIPADLPIRRKVRKGLPNEEDLKFWRGLKQMKVKYIEISAITGWGYDTICRHFRRWKKHGDEYLKKFKGKDNKKVVE